MTRQQACVRAELRGKHFRTREAQANALGRASHHCAAKHGRRR